VVVVFINRLGVLHWLGALVLFVSTAAGGIRRAFVLESSFIALEGVLIGAFLALVTGYQGVTSGDFGEGVSFAVPWAGLVRGKGRPRVTFSTVPKETVLMGAIPTSW
jgi:hypothetical protein